MAVAKLLRDYGRPEWLWFHVPNGEKRDARAGAKLRAMGVRPGMPDLALVSPTGLLHALELKRIGESLTDDQRDFEAWCNASDVPHVVAYTIEEVLAALDHWGALRIKLAGGSTDG